MLELFYMMRKEWNGNIEIRDEDGVYTVYLFTCEDDIDDIIRMFNKGTLTEWE